MFSMSGNSVALLVMQCDIKLRQKYKMAATKPEMVIHPQTKYQKSFLASKTDRNEITTAARTFSGFRNNVVISRMILDVAGSWKFKMAAGKPEILISRLSDEIETRSQRLDPGIRGSGTQWRHRGYCSM